MLSELIIKNLEKSNGVELEFADITDSNEIIISFHNDITPIHSDISIVSVKLVRHKEIDDILRTDIPLYRCAFRDIMDYIISHRMVLVKTGITDKYEVPINTINEIITDTCTPDVDIELEINLLSDMTGNINFTNYNYIIEIKGDCDSIDWDVVKIAAGLDYMMMRGKNCIELHNKKSSIMKIFNVDQKIKDQYHKVDVLFFGLYRKENEDALSNHSLLKDRNFVYLYDAAKFILENDFYTFTVE